MRPEMHARTSRRHCPEHCLHERSGRLRSPCGRVKMEPADTSTTSKSPTPWASDPAPFAHFSAERPPPSERTSRHERHRYRDGSIDPRRTGDRFSASASTRATVGRPPEVCRRSRRETPLAMGQGRCCRACRRNHWGRLGPSLHHRIQRSGRSLRSPRYRIPPDRSRPRQDIAVCDHFGSVEGADREWWRHDKGAAHDWWPGRRADGCRAGVCDVRIHWILPQRHGGRGHTRNVR